METGSSSMGRGKGKKTDKTRRSWTQREEEVLLTLMKELVTSGWKGENGFKVGYLNNLEQSMAKAFPGTDLRGMPHINSKITVWKKTYGSLVTALSRTGVGWNDTTKMLECTDAVWDAVVKADGNARTMRYKSWPLIEDWREIFGKDGATGEHAEDVMEAVNELINEDNMAHADMGNDYHVDMDGFFDDNEGNSVCQTDKSDHGAKSAGKKRKSADVTEGLYELLGQLCRNTDERLDNIARRIGYEYDLGTARKQVFDLLGNIPGLTMDEKLDVSHLLAKNVECLEMFSGLPEDARARYVRRLLGGQI